MKTVNDCKLMQLHLPWNFECY